MQGQQGIDIPEIEVPVARARIGEAVAEGSIGHLRISVRVQQYRLEFDTLPGDSEVGGGQELAGYRDAVLIVQRDQVRQVGVALDVVVETLGSLVHEELSQHHMAHGHGQGGIGAGARGHPFVGELGVVGVVGETTTTF